MEHFKSISDLVAGLKRLQQEAWIHTDTIIRKLNDGQAVRDKDIAFYARQARRQGLFRIVTLLRNLGFHVAPQNLGARHIPVLMAHWTARPCTGAESTSRGQAGLAEGTLQRGLLPAEDELRASSSWITKDGLVRTAQRCVGDPSPRK